MRLLKVSANDLPLAFSTVIPTSAADHQVKTRRDDSGVQSNSASPDGSDRVVYRTPLIAVEIDDDGTITRHEKDITVAVMRPTDLKFGVLYRAQGNAYLVPWIKDGRVAWSITIDGVVPVEAGSSASKKDASGAGTAA